MMLMKPPGKAEPGPFGHNMCREHTHTHPLKFQRIDKIINPIDSITIGIEMDPKLDSSVPVQFAETLNVFRHFRGPPVLRPNIME